MSDIKITTTGLNTTIYSFSEQYTIPVETQIKEADGELTENPKMHREYINYHFDIRSDRQ